MSAGRVIVIGGGFAGLTAATSLAARGRAVTLLEARAHVGGKAYARDAAGARVDLGPTILTDPRPLRALCHVGGTTLEAEVTLERLDPCFVATFDDGARLAWSPDPASMAPALRALGPHAVTDWERFELLGACAAALAERFYERGDIAGVRDLAAFVVAGGLAIRDVVPFVRHGSLASLLDATIRTPELRRLLAHCARFVGLDAETAPSVALVIPYLFATSGVWYPRGGFSALAATLARIAQRAGVEIHNGAEVAGLEVAEGRVRAVLAVSGERLTADAVISAVDVRSTACWLGRHPLARRVARLTPALGTHVAWWVVEGKPAQPAHHAFHFAGGGEPLYVAAPTLTDSTLAPPGRTIVYALEHAPAGTPVPPAAADRWRARLVAAGQWPSGHVLASGVAPTGGSCYGYAIGPGLPRSFRPSQRVAGVSNLILAGGSVFPGPGVANVIRSGLRAAALAAT